MAQYEKKDPSTKHCAKRAILLAAGKGERLKPLSLELPKPLISVNGKSMIESIVSALYLQGIFEIYVVVGYKKEFFETLKEKFSSLRFIENPYFETCNNISSLYAARDYLEDVIIMDADQIIVNPETLHPHFERSCYCAFWQEGDTHEWLLTLKEGIVQSCSRTGGERGWQLQSVSFWTKEDGAQLRRDVEEAFIEKKLGDLFWDDLALFLFPQKYELGIRPILQGDVVEIDTYQELRLQDPTYPQVDCDNSEKRQ